MKHNYRMDDPGIGRRGWLVMAGVCVAIALFLLIMWARAEAAPAEVKIRCRYPGQVYSCAWFPSQLPGGWIVRCECWPPARKAWAR